MSNPPCLYVKEALKRIFFGTSAPIFLQIWKEHQEKKEQGDYFLIYTTGMSMLGTMHSRESEMNGAAAALSWSYWSYWRPRTVC